VEAKIGIICNDDRMIEEAKKVASRRSLNIEIRTSALKAAIPIAKKMEAEGIEALICRGGTADILRRTLSIPVVAIPHFLSTFDLVGDVLRASTIGKKIGLSIYGNNPVPDMDVLERLLRVKINQVVYQDSESLQAGIRRVMREGVDVYIGGNFASEICKEIGVPFFFFGISDARVSKAIDEALLIASVRRGEMEKTKRIEAMLYHVSEGIIAIDRDGSVNIFNRMAEEILGAKYAAGKYREELISNIGLYEVLSTGMPKFQKLCKIDDTTIIANLVPIYLDMEVIGAITSFTDASKVMRAEQNIRRSFTQGFTANYTLDDIVSQSFSMKRLIEQTRKFALSDSTILLTGESGTGKELFAHSIHNLSIRAKGPFVAINCSALHDNLLESELFGYEEGAFTGAKKSGKPGLFELAHQGSIFLDEIGTISTAVQSRLLRVLQQKQVMRISGGLSR
jgi:propionate catabolism operon transcriptional regulator